MAKWRMTRLPKGWKVKNAEWKGVQYIDEKGEVVEWFPKDTNSARHKISEIYKRRVNGESDK